VSAFRSEGRWAPHTTRSWQFLGFEEGIKEPDDSDWLPSLDKSSADVIVGVLDSGMNVNFRDESNEPSCIMIGYSDATVTAPNHPPIVRSKASLANVTATVP